MQKQYTRVTISGKLLEVTQHSTPPLISRKSYGGRKSLPTTDVVDQEHNNKVSNNRARKMIRRLLECNSSDKYAFITLSFNPDLIDTNNLNACTQLFYEFLKKLSYYLRTRGLSPFKYLGVTEFQDGNDKGDIIIILSAISQRYH
jgi:hypothetical protein